MLLVLLCTVVRDMDVHNYIFLSKHMYIHLQQFMSRLIIYNNYYVVFCLADLLPTVIASDIRKHMDWYTKAKIYTIIILVLSKHVYMYLQLFII